MNQIEFDVHEVQEGTVYYRCDPLKDHKSLHFGIPWQVNRGEQIGYSPKT